MKKIFLICLLIIVMVSCVDSFSNKEVIGYYVPIGYKNNYDTIHLMQGGKYHRKVYDKNKKLVLDMVGNYKLRRRGSQIYFESYYLNLDDDLERCSEVANDTVGMALLVLENVDNTIQFCTGYAYNQNCYHKIK